MFPCHALQCAVNYNAFLELSNTDYSDYNGSGGTTQVVYTFQTDGTIDLNRQNQSDATDIGDTKDPREWLSSQSEQQIRDVHCKVTDTGTPGDPVTSITAAYDGTWGKLMGSGNDGACVITWTRSLLGTTAGSVTVELSLDGGTTTHASASFTGTVTVENEV